MKMTPTPASAMARIEASLSAAMPKVIGTPPAGASVGEHDLVQAALGDVGLRVNIYLCPQGRTLILPNHYI